MSKQLSGLYLLFPPLWNHANTIFILFVFTILRLVQAAHFLFFWG